MKTRFDGPDVDFAAFSAFLYEYRRPVDGQYPGCREIGADAVELRRIARRVSRVDVALCNGFRDEADGRRACHSQDRDLQRAREIAARYELAVYHQADPRGCALYLREFWFVRRGIPGRMTASNYSTHGMAVPQ